VASVQGYEFDSALLSQILNRDDIEIEERLKELDEVFDFVRLVYTKDFPDLTSTLRYRFVHVLYQNALYSSLTLSRKKMLNLRIPERLLCLYGEQSDLVASELAFLFEEGRDYGRAAEHYLVAAKNKARVFANWVLPAT